ncbi:GNAT family N-acetyltransferase [Aspergillus japonicus CBS 114.51]|uniref:GNAT family N-acetyltransferase n=2 Tax=Aspergillus TaxID=5052 RepID=A0A2V5HYS1_ASPV1|nr:GNAT family N-acetyltransferase [Aspergillus japonicus CBS 114.51]PYI21440.1 GNAT family N-acetyltransferase [Aspergillus violaceofuscus CBS 115571]RAH84407.1 GNAT family N-acetyltransferase [Aspergillus japonicus CBS 114.51]
MPNALFRIDLRSVSAVAHTISLSFSNDPLIRWLRPAAAPWMRQHTSTFNWQYRRVQRSISEGFVFQSAPVHQIAHLFPPNRGASDSSAFIKKIPDCHDEMDAGVAIMLYPPSRQSRWTIERLILTVKVWFLDLVSPVTDDGANMMRVEKLMKSHDTSLNTIGKKYGLNDLWYLEVLAVHTSLQGRGLGSMAMQWVLDRVQGSPIFLECTAEQNVKFYERLGFEVVEEVDLTDEKDIAKVWLMLRQKQKLGS